MGSRSLLPKGMCPPSAPSGQLRVGSMAGGGAHPAVPSARRALSPWLPVPNWPLSHPSLWAGTELRCGLLSLAASHPRAAQAQGDAIPCESRPELVYWAELAGRSRSEAKRWPHSSPGLGGVWLASCGPDSSCSRPGRQPILQGRRINTGGR